MKIRILFLLLSYITVPILQGSVNLEIGSGITIETGGGVSFEIDGTIIETGYFIGEISSGARTGMTSFAGLTLSSPMDGIITRTTGSVYSKGNGEGINFKRYYEINNTGDIASVDDAGFITITDRLNRFSKIGGEMVPHIKVEEICYAALDTSERVIVVTGRPHEKKGEELVVLYVKDKAAS